jgi:hypothetical protein
LSDGRAFIEAWKAQNPDEYTRTKKQWKAYLEDIGEIPVEERQSPAAKDHYIQEARPIGEPTRIEDDDYIRARDDAMAQSEDTSKSKSWLGQVIRR